MPKIMLKVILFFSVTALTGCLDNQQNEFGAPTAGYVQVDAGKLFYEKFGSGEPILVVHGAGMGHTCFLPQMLELAKDYQLIFYDQRGSGKSLDAALGPQYVNIEKFTKDLEDLRSQLNLEKVVLVGHSWGGFLAMNYALEYPHHVSKLILLDSAASNYEGQKAFEKEFAKRLEPIQDKIAPFYHLEDFQKLSAEEMGNLYRNLFVAHFANPNNIKYLTIDSDKKSILSGYQVCMEMSRTSWPKPEANLLPHLPNLKVPTLIIHGDRDVIPLYTAQQTKNAMPHAKLVCLKNCGHFPFIEQQEKTFEEIRKFLQTE